MHSPRLPWLLFALLVAALLAVLEYWAIADALYWRYAWFDIPMHYLGGLFSGVFIVGMLRRFRPIPFIAAMIIVFAGWELFEAAIGMPRERNFFFDTALDILMDTLGAVTAYVVARFTLWRSA